jgi:hypothetical protein
LSNSWLPTACTDEIARRDQDAVPILGAKLLDERRHRFRAAGGNRDPLRWIARVGDRNAAGGRHEVAVTSTASAHSGRTTTGKSARR